MSKVTKETYPELLENAIQELETNQSNMQNYAENLLIEINTVLDEYSEEWKYVSDLTAGLDPDTQSWSGDLSDEDLTNFEDRYDAALDISSEIQAAGKLIEKAVDSLRDAKRYLNKL